MGRRKNFGRMKKCLGCHLLNRTSSYVCIYCGGELERHGLEPYLYVTPVAQCLREGAFSQEQQTRLLGEILATIQAEEAQLSARSDFSDAHCQEGLKCIYRGLKMIRFLIQEGWDEGESWQLEDWGQWLEDCDEAEADVVRGVDLLQYDGYPSPVTAFTSARG